MKDFYPTPRTLLQKMLDGVDLTGVTEVLEPSAGKGDICDYIKAINPYQRRDIAFDVIEIEPNLQATLKGKGYRLVYNDFLSFQTNKKYDLIIANFPFSNGEYHLQKALSLLEVHGGALICLVNAETIRNSHSNIRKALVNKLDNLGADVQYIENAFNDAERKTDVEVALIKVVLEKKESSFILDGFKKAEDINTSDHVEQSIVEKDFMASLISRFNVECQMGIKLINEYFALKPLVAERIDRPGEDNKYTSPLITLEIDGAYDTKTSYVNSYISGVRYKFWGLLINDPRFSASYTSNVLSDLSKKLKDLRGYDFCQFNIQELQKEMRTKVTAGIEAAILDLFDRCTNKHHFNEDVKNNNIHYFNGWKSNKAHKINNKIILPINGFSSYSWDKDKLDYHINDTLTDMVKVFNYLGDAVDDVRRLVGNRIETANENEDFSAMDMRYFDITFYKKGTCHIKFKDQELLDKFNIFGSQRKGWLPPSYGKKTYGEMETQEKAIVDEFQGEEEYNEIMKNPDQYLFEPNQLLLN